MRRAISLAKLCQYEQEHHRVDHPNGNTLLQSPRIKHLWYTLESALRFAKGYDVVRWVVTSENGVKCVCF